MQVPHINVFCKTNEMHAMTAKKIGDFSKLQQFVTGS